MPIWAQWLTLLAFAVLLFPGEWVYKVGRRAQKIALGFVIVALFWIFVAFLYFGAVRIAKP